ncbi:MAG: transposase [Candidatus Omnitrophota bacterium]
MAVLFQNKYRAKSNRLKEWDYSCEGMYYVTVCTQNKELHFGSIENGKMELSEIGKTAREYWLQIPKHYPFVELDEHIFMPNHVHGVIVINENTRRDAIHRVSMKDEMRKRRDAIHRVSMKNKTQKDRDAMNRVSTGGITNKHNPMLNPNSLAAIIRWYKGRTTFEINKLQNNNLFQWQPRFYDHVIRDEKSLDEIREYIQNNPLKWELDRNNPKNVET